MVDVLEKLEAVWAAEDDEDDLVIPLQVLDQQQFLPGELGVGFPSPLEVSARS